MIGNCVIYVRVSTDDQARDGYSLDAQIDACQKVVADKKLKVVGIFRDEGQSATVKNRPEFQKMISRCEEDSIQFVIVYHTDRFARNSLDHFLVKETLRKAGTALLSYSQPNINDTPEGKFMDTMLAGVNQFFSDDLSRKTKMGLQRKWEEGLWPGWAPVGYKNYSKTDKRKARIEVDPIQGPLVAEAFQKYATGNYSILKLAELMYSKGLVSRHKGGVLTVSTLQQTLSNPYYHGVMRWNGEIKVGKHTPLITKSLFEQCQFVAAKHRQFLIRLRKHRFLLRGFAYCPIHERRLTAEWHLGINSKKRDKVGYYHCTNVGGCKTTYIQSDKLENMVTKLIDRYAFSEEFVEIVKTQMKARIVESKGTINSERQALINKKTGIETRRNKLEDELVDAVIDRPTYKRQHERLENDIVLINNKIANVEGGRKLDMDLVEEVLSLTRNLSKTYRDAPMDLKRHYLRLFFEKLYINNKKIGKILETPIFSTLRKEEKVIIRNTWGG